MRIEFVDDAKDHGTALIFPPQEDYLDLRENPHAVDRIAAARQYLPLRNFLTALNGTESLFATCLLYTSGDGAKAQNANREIGIPRIAGRQPNSNLTWDPIGMLSLIHI